MSSERDDYAILSEITELLKEIGWNIAIPMDEAAEDGKVHGIIAGNDHFINEILDGYNYELFSMTEPDEDNDPGTGIIIESVKKGTFH